MTFWDFLNNLINTGWTNKVLTVLLFGAVFFIVWLLMHPSKVKAWNVLLLTWCARILPRKRKRAFEKRIDLTVDAARSKFAESVPKFMEHFLPYNLKVIWVDQDETMETLLEDNQIVMYVPSYRDEAQQTIGILHNYCSKGFALKAKVYMPEKTREASDLIITGKLAQSAGSHIYDYFNREYRDDVFKRDRSFYIAYDNLRKVDSDGLFLPVFLNEIDKYANAIYPADPTDEIEDIIVSFGNFILKIATRKPGENVNLVFSQGGIRIRIVLAISDVVTSLEGPILSIEESIKEKRVNTIYILATGSKMSFANDIATSVYERNPQDVFEPSITQYKRYTRHPSGNDAICFEINLR